VLLILSIAQHLLAFETTFLEILKYFFNTLFTIVRLCINMLACILTTIIAKLAFVTDFLVAFDAFEKLRGYSIALGAAELFLYSLDRAL
jgi:hypothetical protein